MFNVSSHADTGFNANRHLLINNYDIGGGRHIGANTHVSAANDIVANNILKGKYLEITSTSTFTDDVSAPNIVHKDTGC